MALWTLHKIPKYLTAAEKGLVYVTDGGWEINYPNGKKELLVAINHLSDKQIPRINEITLDASSYDLIVGGDITFNVHYNFPVIPTTLTSGTVLPFTLGLSSLEAYYVSTVDEYTLQFVYNISSDSGDLDAIMAINETLTSLVTDDIVLYGTEKIIIDNNIFDEEYTGNGDFDASLVAQFTIPVIITRPTP